MKKIVFYLFLTLQACITINAKQHHALLVLIGNYPKDSEWWSINAHTDGRWLIPQLEKQDYAITVLSDEQATKQRIVDAFRQMTNNVQSGDVAIIHFSCHGQQMKDDDGDEPDGWDEALIPYDAEMVFERGFYEGENHLRDDELNILLLQLRKALGKDGQVIVTLDTCHSGSGTRDNGKDEPVERGTSILFTPNPEEALHPDDVKRRTMANIDTSLIKGKDLAELTVVSACKSYQTNREVKVNGETGGPLSYILSQLWEVYSIDNPQLWTKHIVNEVRKIARQTPVVETTYTEE